MSATHTLRRPKVLEVDYDEPFSVMAARTNQDWIDRSLNDQVVKFDGTGKVKFYYQVFTLSQSISFRVLTEQLIPQLSQQGLWRPARLEHLLALAALNHDLQTEYAVCSPGTRLRIGSLWCRPFIGIDPKDQRCLSCECEDRPLKPNTQAFLVVRPISYIPHRFVRHTRDQ